MSASSKKQPQYKVQLSLAAALLVISSAAYWYEYSKAPKEEEKSNEEKKPLNLKGLNIGSITLEKGGKKITLNCLDLNQNQCKAGDNSHWELTVPLKFKADDAMVSSLVSTLNNLRPTTTLDLKDETPEKRKKLLTDYKLDADSRAKKEMISATLETQNKETFQIFFGEKHPLEEGYFVLVAKKGIPDESKVYVLPTFQMTAMDQPPNHFRNKQLLTLSQTNVKEVIVSGGKKNPKGLQLKKEGVNWNLILNGQSSPGDNDAIDGLISGAIFLNAKGFAADKKDDPLGKSSLLGAKKIIELKLKTEKDEQTLTLFERKFKDGKKEASQAFAVVSNLDPVFEVDTTNLDRLDKDPKELRFSRLIPTMGRFDLQWIEVDGGKKFKQTILKKDGIWKLDGKDFENAKLDTLLDRLSTAIIDAYPEKSITPVEPQVRMSFGTKPGERKYDFILFQKEGKLWAQNENSATKETFQLKGDLLPQIPWEAAFLTTHESRQKAPH